MKIWKMGSPSTPRETTLTLTSLQPLAVREESPLKFISLGRAWKSTDAAASNEAGVLDLAGQRQWKQCASMEEPRMLFGCGVMQGKIYVCRGLSSTSFTAQPVFGSKVYDPQETAGLLSGE